MERRVEKRYCTKVLGCIQVFYIWHPWWSGCIKFTTMRFVFRVGDLLENQKWHKLLGWEVWTYYGMYETSKFLRIYFFQIQISSFPQFVALFLFYLYFYILSLQNVNWSHWQLWHLLTYSNQVLHCVTVQCQQNSETIKETLFGFILYRQIGYEKKLCLYSR